MSAENMPTTDAELLAWGQRMTKRHDEFEQRHRDLLADLMAAGKLPLDTEEHRITRFARKAEVQAALADLYAAKMAEVEPGTMFSWTLGIAEQAYRNESIESGLRADRARARLERAGGAR